MKTKITNIGSITTWDPDKNELITLNDAEILVEDDKISEIRPKVSGIDEEIDADGALITPGFVDSHTHPVFTGNRSKEFAQRIQGKSYEEIAASGGGILSSIQNIRNINEDQIFDDFDDFCDFRRFLRFLTISVIFHIFSNLWASITLKTNYVFWSF